MWSLYSGNKFLEPRCFSNGKNQKDIVKEVLDLINGGKKFIFISGVCGTGKSAIALNIARKLGRANIVVPIKNLQSQYKKDYEEEKYLKKENGEKLKIHVITGRKNHKCKFLEDNKAAIPFQKNERNASLDIFDKKRRDVEEMISNDFSCDNLNLPCKIEIKEKNWNRIIQYIKQNKDVNASDFQEIKDVRRASIAATCPYWCPALPEDMEFKQKSFASARKKSFQGINGKKYIFYERKVGCPFYSQFKDYIDSDVLVFNSAKYKIETLIGRRPAMEVDIVDECDEFLDSFSNRSSINIAKLQNALIYSTGSSENFDEISKELGELIVFLKRDERINDAVMSGEIIPLKQTGIYDIFRLMIKNPEFFDDIEEESYLFDVLDSARAFEGFYEETFVTVEKEGESLKLNLVTTNLAKMFERILGKNKILIMMSGTLHEDNILKNVFGLQEYKIIEAETSQQGSIEVKKVGGEKDCKYSNFSSGRFSREEYLKILNQCISKAKKPCLVHVHAFKDLPNKDEKESLKLNNLISQEELKNLQTEDEEGELVDNFKEGNINVLFSTRASRGMDFPGEQCNSIVFTKYPNPNIDDAFWKILHKTSPQYYWDFYKDKAKRELWQKVYRGIRFVGDKVEVLSPDLRVLDAFEKRKDN